MNWARRYFRCAECGARVPIRWSPYACACIHYLKVHGRRVDVARMVVIAERNVQVA